jgi:hypothetical protein
METNLTDEQIAHNKVVSLKILFRWNERLGKTAEVPHEMVYTVDANKHINIGGLDENGYMLRFYTSGSPSNVCMTYTNLLHLAAGKTIKQNDFTCKAIL